MIFVVSAEVFFILEKQERGKVRFYISKRGVVSSREMVQVEN